MPRDATATREQLLREAERLFATRGVYRATVREIVEAAGQRNVSALSYHFGAREDVLQAILARHGEPLDEQRGELLTDPIADMATRDLVAALLIPLARHMATEDGRWYLRIVAQLTGRFPVWDIDSRLMTRHLRDVLTELERRAGGASAAIRRERVVNAIMLMMTAMAERARLADDPARPFQLDDGTFVANLADVIVGALEAPAGPALPRA